MREIVFDTETTGLDCLAGDRLIEIGCVELLNHIPTGRTFHRYINPRRPVAYEAGLVHGLTDEFLQGQPGFEEVVDAFFEFVGDSLLVAHNAGFDRGFINMELGALRSRASSREHRFVDTLVLARRRHPNSPRTASMRFAPATPSTRARAAKHGALLDAQDPGGSLSRADGRPPGEPVARRAHAERRAAVAAIGVVRSGCVRVRSLPRITVGGCRAHQAFLSTLGGEPAVAPLPAAEPAARELSETRQVGEAEAQLGCVGCGCCWAPISAIRRR